MKKSTIFILLFFVYACGYTSVYKNVKSQDFNMNIISLEGNMEMNNLIKNQIELFSNNESKNIFRIDIKTDYEKKVIAKDNKGIATNYKLDGIFNFKKF